MASLLFPLLSRYTMAAQDLVMRARGVLRDRGWRITSERLGSGDDISVFIIPLMYGNRQPWGAWQSRCRSGTWKGPLALRPTRLISPKFRICFQFLQCRLHIRFLPWSKVKWNTQSCWRFISLQEFRVAQSFSSSGELQSALLVRKHLNTWLFYQICVTTENKYFGLLKVSLRWLFWTSAEMWKVT